LAAAQSETSRSRTAPLPQSSLNHQQTDNCHWKILIVASHACPELMGLAVNRLEKRWEEPK
jgi:hypothetical protein